MRTLFLVIASAILLTACNNASEVKTDDMDTTQNSETPVIKEEAVDYSAGGTPLKGYVYYDENKQGNRPIVLVVPEWWGLNDYPRMRARKLAELGYLAMAVDMYGNGKVVANPQDAQAEATPFYQNPAMGKERLDAAWAKAKSFPQADSTRSAAIGYCFGGSMVLQSALHGAPYSGVVSFHGGLDGLKPTQKPTAKLLICQGGADSFVPQAQVDAFRKALDSVGADYTLKVYADATHAFTNPDATKTGEKFNMPIRYNAAADSASWTNMKDFFSRIFH